MAWTERISKHRNTFLQPCISCHRGRCFSRICWRNEIRFIEGVDDGRGLKNVISDEIAVDHVHCVHYVLSASIRGGLPRLPLSAHLSRLSTMPAAEFRRITRLLKISLSTSTNTLTSIKAAQSLHPSISSIVYRPSVMTIRCRGVIGVGLGAGSFKA